MTRFRLEINLEPEKISNTFRYFWCIIKEEDSKSPSNNGFGWADSIENAFFQSYSYYRNHIK